MTCDMSVVFLRFPPQIKLISTIYTHYIHSVVLQDFVSGRACCVNQCHVAIATSCDAVISHNRQYLIKSMYVISLSNISIKTDFKQITRVELKFVQYFQGDYILCMTSRYFFRYFTNARLLCFFSLMRQHSSYFSPCEISLSQPVGEIRISLYFSRKNVTFRKMSLYQ